MVPTENDFEHIPESVAFMIALLIKGTFEHIAATTCRAGSFGLMQHYNVSRKYRNTCIGHSIVHPNNLYEMCRENYSITNQSLI